MVATPQSPNDGGASEKRAAAAGNAGRRNYWSNRPVSEGGFGGLIPFYLQTSDQVNYLKK